MTRQCGAYPGKTRKEIVASLLRSGLSNEEVSERASVSVGYVYNVKSSIEYGFMADWEKVTGRLKNSGYDLSKIRLTKQITY